MHKLKAFNRHTAYQAPAAQLSCERAASENLRSGTGLQRDHSQTLLDASSKVLHVDHTFLRSTNRGRIPQALTSLLVVVD